MNKEYFSLKDISVRLGLSMSSIMRRKREHSFPFEAGTYIKIGRRIIFPASFFERLELPVKKEQLNRDGNAI